MSGAERWVLDYVLNAIWQVPLLYGAAWVAARLMRRVGPGAEHRVWVGALVAAVVVPACRLPELRWLRVGGEASRGSVGFGVVTRAVDAGGTWGLPPFAGAVVVAAYFAVLGYFCVRLAWGLWRGWVLQRESRPLRLSGAEARSWERWCGWFGLDGVGLAESEGVDGPVTVGVWRRVLLAPPGFLAGVDAGERDAALAHECAHMQRRDFGWNAVYEVLSLTVAFHPAVWVVKARIAESREQVCDALAAEAMGGERNEYARSLLRLASRMSGRTPVRSVHAIGIFDANILERRVMQLTTKRVEVRRAVRLAVGAACVALGVAACGTAMALRMEVKAPAAAKASDHAAKDGAEVVAPKLLLHRAPEYPEQAKKDKVSGVVLVGMTIGTDGVPSGLHIVKGLRADMDQSSLDALKDWKYSPAMRGGVPVATEITVTLTFSMGY